MTLQYFRWWWHRLGYSKAYLIPWKMSHLLTVMPVWWYRKTPELVLRWLHKVLVGRPFRERFHYELLVREDLSVWSHRLQLWPRWWLTVLTGRSFMP